MNLRENLSRAGVLKYPARVQGFADLAWIVKYAISEDYAPSAYYGRWPAGEFSPFVGAVISRHVQIFGTYGTKRGRIKDRNVGVRSWCDGSLAWIYSVELRCIR